MKKVILALLFFSGCIGTDVLDDALRDPVLTIEDNDGVIQLLIGQSSTLSVSYTNEYGVADDTAPSWSTANTSVATVDQAGVVTAIGPGQTTVTAVIEATEASVLINVSENENEVNNVLITTEASVLEVGQTLQLDATLWTVNNMEVTGVPITWSVDNEAVATISDNGLLQALSNGVVNVTATAAGVSSTPKTVQVGGMSRLGTFQGNSGYDARGTALLFTNDDGDIILEHTNDFQTDFALGTFIYLSNSTNGSTTRNAGLELGEIKMNGGVQFNVSETTANVSLDSYQYVIVLCKPASITFGFAELN